MADTQALSQFNLNQVPGLRQGLLLVGIAAAVALGVAVVMWSRTPDYSLLYSKLPGKDASAVADALQAADIKYRLDANSGAILVPSSEVSKARLKLAAKGLPKSGNVGMDMVGSGKGSTFGTSDFMEKARYQQLLEKDLAHTVSSLQSVKSARVHLAMPKQSVFVRRRQKARASVLVNLYSGRRLNQSQVAAIVHLVASSVPELEPNQVTVVDQKGSLLTDQGSGEMAISSRQHRFKQRVEDNYANRVEQILAPLVGAGNVHAQVVADMDFTRKESTSERYDPAKVLRSEQTSNHTRTGKNPAAIGIPGALSNTPVSAPEKESTTTENKTAKAVGDSEPKSGKKDEEPRDVSSSATRNYELGHTISHTSNPVGTITRLSVAVVIGNPTHMDGSGKAVSTPLPKSELAQLKGLVRDAVGFDAKRGDTVSVVNASFHALPTPPAATSTPWWKKSVVRDYIKQGLGVLIAIALILFVLRPLFRSLAGPSRAAPPRLKGPDGGETEELGADQISLSGGAPQNPGASVPTMNYEQKVGVAKRLASEDPRRVAQVVKNWVGEDG